MFDLSQAFNRFRESRIVALALVMFCMVRSRGRRRRGRWPSLGSDRADGARCGCRKSIAARTMGRNWWPRSDICSRSSPRRLLLVKKKSMWMSPIIIWGDMDPLSVCSAIGLGRIERLQGTEKGQGFRFRIWQYRSLADVGPMRSTCDGGGCRSNFAKAL